jgi:hypothetical protein
MSEHLGDELSALLDGELTPDEQARVDAHLAGCGECRTELEATRAVRERLRGAPAVDPPFGFYQRVLRRRRRWPAVASAVAVAAACVVLVGFAANPANDTRTPPVDALRALAADGQAGPRGLTLHRAEPAPGLPDELVGLPRESSFRAFVEDADATISVFGTSPDHRLVVYSVPGDVEWSSLQGGIRTPVAGLAGRPWQSIGVSLPAIVAHVGDSTVLVTGNVRRDVLEEAAREVGNPSRTSAIDRLRDAAGSLVEAFGLH